MTAIIKRELRAYFTSPIGYIFLGVFYLFSGYFFMTGPLYSSSTNLSTIFSSLFSVFMFLIPILTMRLMSEDRRSKTDQALLTAPISLTGLVMGKFLAAFVMLFIAIAITLLYALVISVFAAPDWAVFTGHFIGILLLGGALISIGMFISSLTESMVVAAIVSFLVMMFLTLVDSIALILNWEAASNFFIGISLYTHYKDFTLGMLDFSDVIFFLSIAAVFIFFTIRVLDRRRWK